MAQRHTGVLESDDDVGRSSPLPLHPSRSVRQVPHDLVANREELRRVREELEIITTSLASDVAETGTTKAHETAQLNPGRPPSHASFPDVSEQIGQLRQRQATLLELLIGHWIWGELDPSDVSALWNEMHNPGASSSS